MDTCNEDEVFLYRETAEKKTPCGVHALQHLKYHLSEGIATVAFNKPKSLNALKLLQVWEMFLIIEHAAHDPAVRVVVWTATGRAFNAGADWKTMMTGEQQKEVDAHIPNDIQEAYRARGMGQPKSNDTACKNLTLAFWDFPKPSVCAVNGLAVGGGANMALANYHDYVVCSEQAKFMWPFSKLNITPELGSTYVMPMVMGFCRAKNLLMSNKWVSSEEAHSLGLCNEVVPHDKLMEAAMAAARNLCSSNITALGLAKKLIHASGREQLSKIMDAENAAINYSLGCEETKERMAQQMTAAKQAKQRATKSRL